MSRKHQYKYHFCRHPRTTQERRIGYDKDHAKYTRGGRKPAQLPTSYDDIFYHRQKSWKKKSKKPKQWLGPRYYIIEEFYLPYPYRWTGPEYYKYRRLISRLYSDDIYFEEKRDKQGNVTVSYYERKSN